MLTTETPPVADDWGYLKPRVKLASRKHVLEFAVRMSGPIGGHIVEFGVYKGDSTRIIRDALDEVCKTNLACEKKRIFACDSFKGLPEKFEKAEAGTFACKPPSIRGVEIVDGYFQDSLTDKLASEVGSVCFASLDADLYSSTICALKWLTPLLHTGSLLLFDEFLGENASEKRAFDEWSAETGIRTVPIALFAREPSGFGSNLDQRALYQVVQADEIALQVAGAAAARPAKKKMMQGLRKIGSRIKRAMK